MSEEAIRHMLALAGDGDADTTDRFGSPISKRVDRAAPPPPPPPPAQKIAGAVFDDAWSRSAVEVAPQEKGKKVEASSESASASAAEEEEEEGEDEEESEKKEADEEEEEEEGEEDEEEEDDDEEGEIVIAQSAPKKARTGDDAKDSDETKLKKERDALLEWGVNIDEKRHNFKEEVNAATTLKALASVKEKFVTTRKSANDRVQRALKRARDKKEKAQTVSADAGKEEAPKTSNEITDADILQALKASEKLVPKAPTEAEKEAARKKLAALEAQEKAEAEASKKVKEVFAQEDAAAPGVQKPNMLRFMVGEAVVAAVAKRMLDSKVKESRVNSLCTWSLLATVVDSIVLVVRPDLTDEANRVTSKSSSSSDKDAVRALRDVSVLPKVLEGTQIANRVKELTAHTTRSSPRLAPLLGFAAMAACKAVLNAVLVVDRDRRNLAIATATSDAHKASFRVAVGCMQQIGLLKVTQSLDAELSEAWRVKVNRMTSVKLPANSQPLIYDGDLAQNPLNLVSPSGKRARFEESTPKTNAESTETTRRFEMDMKMASVNGVMHFPTDRAFKYDAGPLLRQLNLARVTLIPNRTMMNLLAMMFDALHRPESSSTLFSVIYKWHMRLLTTEATAPQRKCNPFSSIMLNVSDISVPDRTNKFYKDNKLPHLPHDYFVQNSRSVVSDFITKQSHEVSKEMVEWELPLAHILFSFLRMDPMFAVDRIGGVAHHPAARVVTSLADNYGEPVTLTVNQLPTNVGLRVSPTMNTLLQHMWIGWLKHLGLLDAKKQPVPNAASMFLAAYEKATYGSMQWLVNAFIKPDAVVPVERVREAREAMLPIMFALFPPAFMGDIPDWAKATQK
jgi:hypothetical protein